MGAKYRGSSLVSSSPTWAADQGHSHVGVGCILPPGNFGGPPIAIDIGYSQVVNFVTGHNRADSGRLRSKYAIGSPSPALRAKKHGFPCDFPGARGRPPAVLFDAVLKSRRFIGRGWRKAKGRIVCRPMHRRKRPLMAALDRYHRSRAHRTRRGAVADCRP